MAARAAVFSSDVPSGELQSVCLHFGVFLMPIVSEGEVCFWQHTSCKLLKAGSYDKYKGYIGAMVYPENSIELS
jgi:hypothetical protein